MSVLLEPYLTSCPSPGCRNWQVACSSVTERLRLEEKHRARLHPPMTGSAVADLITADPRHETERDEIVAAIEVVLARDGEVSANTVRPLLPAHVLPQLVGGVFSALSRPGGRLVRVERERSTDTRGRNTHHDIAVYRAREAS